MRLRATTPYEADLRDIRSISDLARLELILEALDTEVDNIKSQLEVASVGGPDHPFFADRAGWQSRAETALQTLLNQRRLCKRRRDKLLREMAPNVAAGVALPFAKLFVAVARSTLPRETFLRIEADANRQLSRAPR